MASLQRFISTHATAQPHPNGIGSYPQVFIRKHIVSMTPKSLVKVYENGFPKIMSLSQLQALLKTNNTHSLRSSTFAATQSHERSECKAARETAHISTHETGSTPNGSCASTPIASPDHASAFTHRTTSTPTGTISLHEFIGGGQSFKLFFNIDPQKYIVQNIVRDVKKFLLTSDSVQRILFNGFTMSAEQMVNRTVELRHAGIVRVVFSNVVIGWKHYKRLIHEFITDDYSVEPFQEIIDANCLLNIVPKERLSVSVSSAP